MESLRAKHIQKFVDYMVSFLKSEVPEVVSGANEQELREFVLHGVDQAANYGIEDPYLIQQYILFMAWVGPDFDTDARNRWAWEILNDHGLTPQDKVIRLEDYIMSEWEGSK
jgi:hypothetical protein